MKTAEGIFFFSATYDELAIDVLTGCYGIEKDYSLTVLTTRSIVAGQSTEQYDATWPSLSNEDELRKAITGKLYDEGL